MRSITLYSDISNKPVPDFFDDISSNILSLITKWNPLPFSNKKIRVERLAFSRLNLLFDEKYDRS